MFIFLSYSCRNVLVTRSDRQWIGDSEVPVQGAGKRASVCTFGRSRALERSLDKENQNYKLTVSG
jgi:hypothetical protein